MLKLIQVEFLKLRRRTFIWLMLLAALFMPLAAVFYFASVKETGVEPIEFYKWTAFSYTPWIILPVVLGMLCTMLMYNENQYDMLKQLWIVMLKQLWIVPVNKMAYFFSKFAVVLMYSVCFMLITAAVSILSGVLPGYIAFDSGSVLYLLRKCMEISLLTAFAVLPILAVAAAQKGYILPVCMTLVYTADRLCGTANTGSCRSTKGLYSSRLSDTGLYIPRLYPLDGEYVPASAVQYDRHCHAGYSGCRNYPATQYSGGVPLHRRVGRCFCPAGWGCFEKEKVRCI